MLVLSGYLYNESAFSAVEFRFRLEDVPRNLAFSDQILMTLLELLQELIYYFLSLVLKVDADLIYHLGVNYSLDLLPPVDFEILNFYLILFFDVKALND